MAEHPLREKPTVRAIAADSHQTRLLAAVRESVSVQEGQPVSCWVEAQMGKKMMAGGIAGALTGIDDIGDAQQQTAGVVFNFRNKYTVCGRDGISWMLVLLGGVTVTAKPMGATVVDGKTKGGALVHNMAAAIKLGQLLPARCVIDAADSFVVLQLIDNEVISIRQPLLARALWEIKGCGCGDISQSIGIKRIDDTYGGTIAWTRRVINPIDSQNQREPGFSATDFQIMEPEKMVPGAVSQPDDFARRTHADIFPGDRVISRLLSELLLQNANNEIIGIMTQGISSVILPLPGRDI